MDKHIPLEKMSKKERMAYHKRRRRTWGALSPVTRKPRNPKAYNRAKARQRREEDPAVFFLWPKGFLCFSLLM